MTKQKNGFLDAVLKFRHKVIDWSAVSSVQKGWLIPPYSSTAWEVCTIDSMNCSLLSVGVAAFHFSHHLLKKKKGKKKRLFKIPYKQKIGKKFSRILGWLTFKNVASPAEEELVEKLLAHQSQKLLTIFLGGPLFGRGTQQVQEVMSYNQVPHCTSCSSFPKHLPV